MMGVPDRPRIDFSASAPVGIMVKNDPTLA
jgi:hypothetical protein